MLLFVVFELWGTGLQQAQAQGGLEDDFQARLQQAATAGQGPPAAERAAPATTAPSTGGGDPGVADTVESVPATTDDGGEDPETAAPEPAPDRTDAPEPAPDGTDAPEPAPDRTDAPEPAAAGRQAQPDTSSLPERPGVPDVVRDISQPAVTRAAATALDPEVETLLPLLYPDAGEALGRITIPAIDVHAIVVVGVGTEDLRKGPGHYGSTPLPGQPGNAAIAGHRTTYGAPFGRIDELAPGDRIIVETLQGTFVYRVVQHSDDLAGRGIGHSIVAPSAVEVLDDYGDNRLTLTSCHPKYSSRQRIVVQATLVGEPVVRLPRPGEPIGAEAVLASDEADPTTTEPDPTTTEPGAARQDLDRSPDTAEARPAGRPPMREARPAGRAVPMREARPAGRAVPMREARPAGRPPMGAATLRRPPPPTAPRRRTPTAPTAPRRRTPTAPTAPRRRIPTATISRTSQPPSRPAAPAPPPRRRRPATARSRHQTRPPRRPPRGRRPASEKA